MRATWTDVCYVTEDARVPPVVLTLRMKPDAEFDFPFPDGGMYHVTTNARALTERLAPLIERTWREKAR